MTQIASFISFLSLLTVIIVQQLIIRLALLTVNPHQQRTSLKSINGLVILPAPKQIFIILHLAETNSANFHFLHQRIMVLLNVCIWVFSPICLHVFLVPCFIISVSLLLSTEKAHYLILLCNMQNDKVVSDLHFTSGSINMRLTK